MIKSLFILLNLGALSLIPSVYTEDKIVMVTSIDNQSFIEGSRKIEKSGSDFIVTAAIPIGKHSGFARLKETIPAGFNAISIEADGAVFNFTNQNVKFLWSQIPPGIASLKVSYKLIPLENASKNFAITGYFSSELLTEDDHIKNTYLPRATFPFNETIAQKDIKGTNKKDNIDSIEPIQTTFSNPIMNISFRVQVLAAHKTVDVRYIKKRYNGYNKKLHLDNHEGWVKYTTDGVSTYKGARDTRNSVKKYDFPDPFVTAYNSGERITVQEAFMLSSQ